MEIIPVAFAFGELEVSPITVGFLIGLTIFTFAAVGISSLKLFQGAEDVFENDSDER